MSISVIFIIIYLVSAIVCNVFLNILNETGFVRHYLKSFFQEEQILNKLCNFIFYGLSFLPIVNTFFAFISIKSFAASGWKLKTFKEDISKIVNNRF